MHSPRNNYSNTLILFPKRTSLNFHSFSPTTTNDTFENHDRDFLLLFGGELTNKQGTIDLMKHNIFDSIKLQVKQLEDDKVVNPYRLLPFVSLVLS
jgi:hypothetical protein